MRTRQFVIVHEGTGSYDRHIRKAISGFAELCGFAGH